MENKVTLSLEYFEELRRLSQIGVSAEHICISIPASKHEYYMMPHNLYVGKDADTMVKNLILELKAVNESLTKHNSSLRCRVDRLEDELFKAKMRLDKRKHFGLW